MKIGPAVAGDPAKMGLEHRVFNTVTFLACVFTALATVINFLGLLIGPAVITGIGSLLFALLFYFARRRSLFRPLVTPFIVLATILVCGAWFANGGLLGSMPVILPLALILFLMLLTSRRTLPSLIFVSVLTAGLIGLETAFPEWVVPYPNEQIRRIDILSAVFVTLGCIAWLLHRLRRAYEDERGKVQKRNRDLKKSHRELIQARNDSEQSARAKAEFLSVMSHEIRTPMNAVVGMTYLLEKENLQPEHQEYISILKESSETLTALLNDILDFSKIESGKVVLERAPVNITELVMKVVRLFQHRAREKRLNLEARLSPRIPETVLGDRLRLSQILSNLVGNAVKFTHAGTVRIRARVMKRTEKEVVLLFTIVDTGIGIPRESLDDVFDSFAQARDDSSWKYGGTGLGLTITRRLLEMQNGRIRVRSSPGIGSIFAFTIPMGIASDSAPAVSTSTASVNLAGYRVLVVDDFEPNVLLARKFLEKWELEVDTAVDGALALEKINNENFDLILMDLRMPEMDGFEASRRVRALPDQVKSMVPIIALTAAASPEERGEALRAGIDDYLIKPYDPAELREKLQVFLGRARSRRE